MSLFAAACGGGADRPTPVAPPPVPQVNLSLERAWPTQVVQDDDATVPLLAGTAAALNVFVGRSRESVTPVPVVLRLFRNGNLVRADTTRTVGVLGPLTVISPTSAQFLIPAGLVASDVSWQVELDPANTQPDSTRTDNRLPLSAPAPLRTLTAPTIRLRLVPVTLSRHGDITGDVSQSNVELYVRLARQIFPFGALSVTVGAPVVTDAFFGSLPGPGADVGFWSVVLRDVDGARTDAGASEEYWYGVVPVVAGHEKLVFGGYGYLPNVPQHTGSGARSGVGLGISRTISAAFAQQTLAHELGHNFGRRHAPGCGAGAPLDSVYPSPLGSISAVGHDVWSWSQGQALGAADVSRDIGDVMSYCAPKWISPYTYKAVLAWRSASLTQQRILGPLTSVAVP